MGKNANLASRFIVSFILFAMAIVVPFILKTTGIIESALFTLLSAVIVIVFISKALYVSSVIKFFDMEKLEPSVLDYLKFMLLPIAIDKELKRVIDEEDLGFNIPISTITSLPFVLSIINFILFTVRLVYDYLITGFTYQTSIGFVLTSFTVLSYILLSLSRASVLGYLRNELGAYYSVSTNDNRMYMINIIVSIASTLYMVGGIILGFAGMNINVPSITVGILIYSCVIAPILGRFSMSYIYKLYNTDEEVEKIPLKELERIRAKIK